MGPGYQGALPISAELSAALQGFLTKKEYTEPELKVKQKLERVLAEVDKLNASVAIMQGRIDEAIGNITKKAGQVELLMEVMSEAQPQEAESSTEEPEAAEEPQDASDPGQQN